MNWLIRKLLLRTLPAKLLLALFIALGWFACQSMVRENNPDLEIPNAMVATEWPGAAPEQVESEITIPLENEILSLPGLKTFSSGSYDSNSIIFLQFSSDMSLSQTMEQLRASVDRAAVNFPTYANVNKPFVEQSAISNIPVTSWILHGDVDELVLADMARKLKSRFKKIPGVKQVYLRGLRDKSLHIRLDPYQLKALGISPLYVLERLQTANMDMGWGKMAGPENSLHLLMSGRFDNLEQVRNLPIKRITDNRLVRLGEIAQVSPGPDQEQSRTFFSMNGHRYTRGITLDVAKRPDTDTQVLIQSVSEQADKMTSSQDWPADLELTRVTDEGELIDVALGNITTSLLQSVVIIFLLLMLMLNWREALIAAIGLPVTLLAMLGFMETMGYTLNIMVMIGMVLALGLLVDTFILIMEGMHEGIFVRQESFNRAIGNTVNTFALPVVAGQVTTILALVPLMMIPGVDGKFIRIIPLTASLCLLISLIVAFFICLPLSRYLLDTTRNPINNKQQPLLIDRITHHCNRQLADWLRQQPLKSRRQALTWIISALAMFILSLVMAAHMPALMYPPADHRTIGVSLELPPEATLGQAQTVADKVTDYLNKQPWIEKYIAYVGAKSPVTRATTNAHLLPEYAANQVGFTLILAEKNKREKRSFDYLQQIRAGIKETIANEAGVELYLTHTGGYPTAEAPIQIDLTGPDNRTLQQISAQVQEQLAQQTGAVGIQDNLGPVVAKMVFRLDQEKLSFHGLNERDVARQVRLAMAEDEYGNFRVEGLEKELKIRLSTLWPTTHDGTGKPQHLRDIRQLPVIAPNGSAVFLKDIANFTIESVPEVLIHKNGQRAITINAMAEGRTARDIMRLFIPVLEQMKSDWPNGYDYSIGGETTEVDKSNTHMGNAFLLALIMIYILLALMFNSLGQPLIVLSVVPMALTGTFTGFFLAGIPLSLASLIGVVSSVGIAVNDSIIMLEVINHHERSGKSIVESAALGVSERLRPILSTSLTTILCLIPLALSAPQWSPLCLAIIFGLLTSTMGGLVIVPALYLLWNGKTSDTPQYVENL